MADSGLPESKASAKHRQKVSEIKDSLKTQHQKFVEAARELECDDNEGRFRERFKKLTEAWEQLREFSSRASGSPEASPTLPTLH